MKQPDGTFRLTACAHEDFEPVTAKALDFALAVVGHELGAVERQQAMATWDVAPGRPACLCEDIKRS